MEAKTTRRKKIRNIAITDPEAYLAAVKEGIELALNGCTDVHSVEDVQKCLKEIKEKWNDWERREEEYLKLI